MFCAYLVPYWEGLYKQCLLSNPTMFIDIIKYVAIAMFIRKMQRIAGKL